LLTYILNKNPQRRLTIEQIKQHPFFSEINWEDLTAKKIKPPLFLSQKDLEDVSDEEKDPQDAEALFLKSAEKIKKTKKKKKFKDEDYTEENKTLNRLKQFTFVQNTEEAPQEKTPEVSDP
jgi:serine/threonine protein kinase